MSIALIISATQAGKESISSLLAPHAFSQLYFATGSLDAKRLLETQHYFALVVINSPLSDEEGYQLAFHTAKTTCSSVILLVKHELPLLIAQQCEALGIEVILKPFPRNQFYTAVKIAKAFEMRFGVIQAENKRLQRQLAEVRTIHQAKCVLIQNLCMSEKSAHHYIEKQAMDSRQTKYDIAMDILHTHGQ